MVQEKGNTNFGIYELEGEKWRLCLNTRGATRPAKFAAEAGSGIVVEVLERGLPAALEKSKSPEPFDFGNMILEAAPELRGEWSMVSGMFEGYPLDRNFVRLGKRVVEGNEMSVTFGRELYSKARYHTDRSKTPIAIDVYNTAGGSAGKMQYGIYELDGRILRLSIAAAGRANGPMTSLPRWEMDGRW